MIIETGDMRKVLNTEIIVPETIFLFAAISAIKFCQTVLLFFLLIMV
jgi:hypothetical protein